MPIYKMNGKKDGRQQYRVRINYTDKNGKSKQIDRVAYGNAEAKDLERKLMEEIKGKVKPSDMTVQQLYEEYMEIKKHEVRETTLKQSQTVLNIHVLPFFQNTQLKNIDNRSLQKWKSDISDDNFSLKTKQNIYKEFRAMLNYAVKMEYLPKNPLTSVGNFKEVYFEIPKDKPQYYTSEQFKKYIASARENCTNLTDWGYYISLLLHIIQA